MPREVRSMKTAIVYVGAAVAEIAGCFAFWGWLRLGKPIWWLLPGVFSLIVFAYLLTLVETEAAGRAYATYGGIYIVASLLWLWIVESARPDRWDITGASICLIGAAVILWGPLDNAMLTCAPATMRYSRPHRAASSRPPGARGLSSRSRLRAGCPWRAGRRTCAGARPR